MPKGANIVPVKTLEQRGVIGAWAYLARREADLSVEQVVAALGEQDVLVSPATIRGVESGAKKPSARLLRQLGTVLGSTPPGQTEQANDSTRDLADAIRRQAAAIEQLVGLQTGAPFGRVVDLPGSALVAPTEDVQRTRRRWWIGFARKRLFPNRADAARALRVGVEELAGWEHGTDQPIGAETTNLAETLGVSPSLFTDPPETPEDAYQRHRIGRVGDEARHERRPQRRAAAAS